jgi:uncharacterized protein (DUF885 family)
VPERIVMSDAISKFKELNKLAEKQKEERARIKGSMDQIAKTLKEKGYKNLTEANADIKKMNKDKEKRIKKRDSLMESFEEKYAKYL